MRLPGVVGALFEKEARYTLRNWQLLWRLFIPAFFVLVLGSSLKHDSLFVHHADMAFPLAIAYAFFSETMWVFNSLGYEGGGMRLLLLAPVRFRQVMIGKNLFYAAATLVNLLAVCICVRWIFGPAGPMVTMATLFAVLYALFVNLTVGNVVSVWFASRLEFGMRRGNSPSGMALFISLVTQAMVIGSGGVVFMAGKLLDHMGIAALVFVGLAGVAGAGYAVCLMKIDQLAADRRESLMEELCRAGS